MPDLHHLQSASRSTEEDTSLIITALSMNIILSGNEASLLMCSVWVAANKEVVLFLKAGTVLSPGPRLPQCPR